MIYLDTHVIVWLYAGLTDKLNNNIIDLIENNTLLISPLVKLELTYLHETKRISHTSQTIIHELENRLGLTICDTPFNSIVNKANTLTWTRDPFDRLITASALLNHVKLITKDKVIRKHTKLAVWE